MTGSTVGSWLSIGGSAIAITSVLIVRYRAADPSPSEIRVFRWILVMFTATLAVNLIRPFVSSGVYLTSAVLYFLLVIVGCIRVSLERRRA